MKPAAAGSSGEEEENLTRFLEPGNNYETGYTFLRWNGLYGEDAIFLVRDNSNGYEGLFTPGYPDKIMWSEQNLELVYPQLLTWSDFGYETVDDLTDLAF